MHKATNRGRRNAECNESCSDDNAAIKRFFEVAAVVANRLLQSVFVQVETVGDSYTCVSGVPIRNPDHTAEIADMALGIRFAVAEFKV